LFLKFHAENVKGFLMPWRKKDNIFSSLFLIVCSYIKIRKLETDKSCSKFVVKKKKVANPRFLSIF